MCSQFFQQQPSPTVSSGTNSNSSFANVLATPQLLSSRDGFSGSAGFFPPALVHTRHLWSDRVFHLFRQNWSRPWCQASLSISLNCWRNRQTFLRLPFPFGTIVLCFAPCASRKTSQTLRPGTRRSLSSPLYGRRIILTEPWTCSGINF